MKPTIRMEHHLVAVQSEQTVHAMLELVAPDAPNARDRAPLYLALVIDRSGSMSGEKLATTKTCAAFLARRLAPTDQMAVISYDDDVALVAPLAPVNPDHLVAAIDTIRAGGQTNLSGGWLKGREVLDAAPDGSVRKILLLTDGQANTGITEPTRLVGLAQQAAAGRVGTTTIGFGDDFDEALLTAMADAGGGNAHHAASPDAAPAIFAEEFEGLTAIVAQNVSVELRPSADVSVLAVLAVLNGYPVTEVPGGLQLALGDAYGGERRTVVFELHLPALADLGPVKVADAVIRYVAVGDQIAAHEVTVPVVVNVTTPDEAAAAAADHEVTDEVTILAAARARDTARRLADAGDFDGAKSALTAGAHRLREHAVGSAKADLLVAEAELLESSALAVEPTTYGSAMQKSMHYDAHRSRRRRS